MHGVTGQASVSQRVRLVTGLLQCTFVEGIHVDDERPAANDVRKIRLQRSRVHGHQHARCVARGQDVVVRDVDLERRYPREGPRRSTDLCGEVGKGGRVVPEEGADGRELRPGQLDPVAGVPAKRMTTRSSSVVCACMAVDTCPPYLRALHGCRGHRLHVQSPLRVVAASSTSIPLVGG